MEKIDKEQLHTVVVENIEYGVFDELQQIAEHLFIEGKIPEENNSETIKFIIEDYYKTLIEP